MSFRIWVYVFQWVAKLDVWFQSAVFTLGLSCLLPLLKMRLVYANFMDETIEAQRS